MFGRIISISNNNAFIENNASTAYNADLLNLHVIFESNNNKVLSEIEEINDNNIKVKFLGEFDENGKFLPGVLHKPQLNSTIRTINGAELIELTGKENINSLKLGKSALYKNFDICPSINSLFANHLCILGNSGSGKSYGVARILQNIFENKNMFSYNTNIVFFDTFGEYKNSFNNISSINQYYNFKFLTLNKKDDTDCDIVLPIYLLNVDDISILLGADKHAQITILERSLKYAKIFAMNDENSNSYKNTVIANAMLTILYSNNTIQQKKDDIFNILNTCNTNEFNFNATIPGIGYTRNLSECFAIDGKGRFGEEVLITEYILKYANIEAKYQVNENVLFTLEDFAKALEFTLISEGFTQNKNMHDDAELLKVRLKSLINSNIGKIFNTTSFIPFNDFINSLFISNNKKSQVININLEGIDDAYAKAIVKIFSHLFFEYSKINNSNTRPFHLFLEEAHRYIQKDNDVFLLGYNIFERIAKEGRKYGVVLDIISQRPMEISDTVISQCSNFLIFKMTHPKDIEYVEAMLPNISSDVIEKMKVLQPGNCVGFGSAFKIPFIIKLDLPSPAPCSQSCDVVNSWNYKQN